jgi:hypothetical protein
MMPRTLITLREDILELREKIQQAANQHGWLYGLVDADNLVADAASQIGGEIAKCLPEHPIIEQRP